MLDPYLGYLIIVFLPGKKIQVTFFFLGFTWASLPPTSDVG